MAEVWQSLNMMRAINNELRKKGSWEQFCGTLCILLYISAKLCFRGK